MNQQDKISKNFVINQYRSGVHNYVEATKDIGLWESEVYAFRKYLDKTANILDIGCGTGRTTIALYKLGYKKIKGIDLTPEMIKAAIEISNSEKLNIPFEIADATELKEKEQAYDSVIFSFNGLMSIPNALNRNKVINNIHRVLKTKGIFIFTTHDRDKDPSFFQFWKDEVIKWSNKKNDPRLYEFGDVIADSKNETAKIFIHIPSQAEVAEMLEKNSFKVLETFYRSDLFEENNKVKEKSGECRFWIAQKV